jgi:2',3'-cyclic-nucleotide 2'-phosphodiesterase (5'-nucleotidase family)
LARWATFINRTRDANANWLTVDCGNFVDRAGTGGGCTSKCQFTVASYEDLKYDVLNLARQEVWMGYETIKALQDTSHGTEYVSANLVGKKTGKPVAKPYVIKDYGNMKVGIVGLIDEADYPAASSQMDTMTLKVTPYIEAAKKYIPSLAKKTNAVILLCELSSARIESLLAVVPDIDLVISSGALRTGETPAKVGKTQIVGPGSSGYNGHYATLTFDPAKKNEIGFDAQNIALDEVYEEPGKWADRLAAFNNAPPVQSTPAPTPATLSPQNATPTNSVAKPTHG